jgi:hypothetical protein
MDDTVHDHPGPGHQARQEGAAHPDRAHQVHVEHLRPVLVVQIEKPRGLSPSAATHVIDQKIDPAEHVRQLGRAVRGGEIRVHLGRARGLEFLGRRPGDTGDADSLGHQCPYRGQADSPAGSCHHRRFAIDVEVHRSTFLEL